MEIVSPRALEMSSLVLTKDFIIFHSLKTCESVKKKYCSVLANRIIGPKAMFHD